MARFISLSLVLICLLFGLLQRGNAQDAQEPPLIREIVFRGFTNVPSTVPALVQQAVTASQLWQPYTADAVAKDKEAIRQLGWFARVAAGTEPMANGVRLVFTVTENPVVEKITFDGNTSLTDTQLALAIPTMPHQVANPTKDIQAILGLYKLLGYSLTSVTNTAIAKGQVTYTIAEPVVKEIRITGNQHLATATLLPDIMIKPGEVYNDKLIRQSLVNLRQQQHLKEVLAVPKPADPQGGLLLEFQVKE